MADILGQAIDRIAELPEAPTLVDLADAIEFVTRGMLVVELHENAPNEDAWKPYHGWDASGSPIHLALATLLRPGLFKTIPNRGQVGGMRAVEKGEADRRTITEVAVSSDESVLICPRCQASLDTSMYAEVADHIVMRCARCRYERPLSEFRSA